MFKIGDKVVVVSSKDELHYRMGDVGTVVEILFESKHVTALDVDFGPNHFKQHSQGATWAVLDTELELFNG